MSDSDQSGQEAVTAIGGAAAAGMVIGSAIAPGPGTVIGAAVAAIIAGTALIIGEVGKK